MSENWDDVASEAAGVASGYLGFLHGDRGAVRLYDLNAEYEELGLEGERLSSDLWVVWGNDHYLNNWRTQCRVELLLGELEQLNATPLGFGLTEPDSAEWSRGGKSWAMVVSCPDGARLRAVLEDVHEFVESLLRDPRPLVDGSRSGGVKRLLARIAPIVREAEEAYAEDAAIREDSCPPMWRRWAQASRPAASGA
jgi:hypothetical protein